METTGQINILSALVPFAITIFVIALGVIVLSQHFRKNLYKQKLKQEELNASHHRELLRSTVQTQESERKRIAGNLHDELGAVLSMARMHILQLEEQNAGDGSRLVSSLQNVRNLTESALATMRRISHELMPPELEMLGITKTIEAVIERANDLDKIVVKFDHSKDLPETPWNIQLGIYRIFLELLNNTIKHAAATEITVQLNHENDHLSFFYHDNGIGLPEHQNVAGLGIKNVQARISAMGAKVVAPGTSTGFSLKIQIPLDPH